MKTLSAVLMFVLLGIAAEAQTPRVVAEIAASSDRAIKGAPFSAEAVSESVQTLADGNRIVRRWTNKMYRNSEGRFRREGAMGGSLFGTAVFGEPAVVIQHPDGGYRYHLDTNAKTARAVTVYAPSAVGAGGAQGQSIIISGPENEKLAAELAARAAEARRSATVVQGEGVRPVEITKLTTVGTGGTVAGFTAGQNSKYETRTEALGMQNIEGVEAEGTRTVTTIPADAIGNERPIEIVYERWYSKELQLVVASRHYDPRFGEQTYRLTNIVRSEPDPSLFEVPQGYRIQNDPQNFYRTAPARRPTAERPAVRATAATKP